MGNIQSLDRKGHIDANATTFGEMDKLSYTYEATGHKLVSVTDAGNTNFGFKDGNTIGNDYEYDQNGSITVDKNKGIIDIQYNHLDLPVEIVFDSITPKKISYIYDAGGVKLKKILNDGGTITTTEYAAAQYKNGVLEFMGQPEGYIEKTSTSSGVERYQYVYQYADHLGNIRLSYSDKNDDGSITQEEIIEENNYYPFGLQQKRPNIPVNGRSHQYKYNNTELEEGLGLNWYEMPLRSYDPTIARWNRVDPVTHYGLSTYNTFGNNPIYYNDPSGGSHHEIREGRMVNTRDLRQDPNANVSYNWNTGQYENGNGNAVGYGTALASVGVSVDTNRNNRYSGTAMLSAALDYLGVDYNIRSSGQRQFKWLDGGNGQMEFGEEWDDNITVNADGIVTNVDPNDQPDRFFDENGNELFFNDPEVDFEFLNEWQKGDRLFFPIGNTELLSAILNNGGVEPLILRSLGSVGGAWLSAALNSHGGGDFTQTYLVWNYLTSTERSYLVSGRKRQVLQEFKEKTYRYLVIIPSFRLTIWRLLSLF